MGPETSFCRFWGAITTYGSWITTLFDKETGLEEQEN
jgi:hypothetical protein